jgi:hypothetical protein
MLKESGKTNGIYVVSLAVDVKLKEVEETGRTLSCC